MGELASVGVSGLLGSLLGGVFRIAPEVLKWLDRKNERAHELAMFEKQVDLEKTRGAQKLAEIGAERDAKVDIGATDALKLVIQQQTDMAKAAGGKIAAMSASVRPVLTYWMWTIYSVCLTVVVTKAILSGMDARAIVALVMTPDFVALLSGITNYWFLDRTLSKRGLL